MDEPYDKLYVVSSHSEVTQPMVRVPIPANMAVTTPCSLNEIAIARVQDIISGFQPLFKRENYVEVRNSNMKRAVWVRPNESDIKAALIQMRTSGIIRAIRDSQPIDSVFTQRKHSSPFTRQTCFMTGSAVPVSITEFSKDTPDGADITPRILGRRDVQIYRATNAKDAMIIGIEKRLMEIDEAQIKRESGGVVSTKFVKCPAPERIILESKNSISQQDINDLYRNRKAYCHAIGLAKPPDILCSLDIDSEVEPLRLGILDIIIRQKGLIHDYFKNAESNAEVIQTIKTDFKRPGAVNMMNKLTEFLIFSIMESIRSNGNAVRDYKIVNSGYEEIPSDVLLQRIHAINPKEHVYVLIIGCRCIQTTDPGILSRTRSSEPNPPHIEYFGGRKRLRRTMKRKFRKTPKRKRLYGKKTSRRLVG